MHVNFTRLRTLKLRDSGIHLKTINIHVRLFPKCSVYFAMMNRFGIDSFNNYGKILPIWYSNLSNKTKSLIITAFSSR